MQKAANVASSAMMEGLPKACSMCPARPHTQQVQTQDRQQFKPSWYALCHWQVALPLTGRRKEKLHMHQMHDILSKHTPKVPCRVATSCADSSLPCVFKPPSFCTTQTKSLNVYHSTNTAWHRWQGRGGPSNPGLMSH